MRTTPQGVWTCHLTLAVWILLKDPSKARQLPYEGKFSVHMRRTSSQCGWRQGRGKCHLNLTMGTTMDDSCWRPEFALVWLRGTAAQSSGSASSIKLDVELVRQEIGRVRTVKRIGKPEHLQQGAAAPFGSQCERRDDWRMVCYWPRSVVLPVLCSHDGCRW
ncbi:hypothetical protein BGW80DRAFT_1247500 [Lactifluus volemus]|nr:hypothetical protein BGW80DRAFT_1247500 [Lactifluus volemus]